MGLYRVDAMEALIHTRLMEPSTVILTSATILQAINDGQKEVASRAFCIENEDTVNTVAGNRLVSFSGHKVNYAHVISKISTVTGASTATRNWTNVAMSATGQYQVAVTYLGYIYVSSDYGVTWTPKGDIASWTHVAISSTGQYQTVGGAIVKVKVSSDYGITWTDKGSLQSLRGLDISSSGQYQTHGGTGGIYISTDYGETWTNKDISGAYNVSMIDSGATQICDTSLGFKRSTNYGSTWGLYGETDATRIKLAVSSSTGQYVTSASQSSYPLRVSSDYGATYSDKGIATGYRDIDLSSSGQYQIACGPNYIYVSSDYGINWTAGTLNHSWYGVAISSTGQYQTAVAFGDKIYFSSDYGVTWNDYQSTTTYDYTVARSMTKISPTNAGYIPISGSAPQYWFPWGNQIAVEPMPDDVYALKLFVSDYPAAELTLTTEFPSSLPDEFHPCIVDFACYVLSMRLCKWGQASRFYNLYINNLKKRRKEYMDRKAEMRVFHRIPDKVKYADGRPWAH